MKVKHLAILLVLGIPMLFFASCKGVPGKVAVTANIGQEGGEVRSDNDAIVINVPSGAFSEATEIHVTENSDSEAMGVDQASNVFEIAGMGQYTKAITFHIQTTKPLGGDTYVAVGMQTEAPSGLEQGLGFVYIPCVVEDGGVSFKLDPEVVLTTGQRWMRWALSRTGQVYADKKATIGPVITAAVITNQSTVNKEHFTVVADSDVKTVQIETVASYLEYVYGFYSGMGFDLDKYKHWPLQVKVRGLYRGLERNLFGGGEQDAGYFYTVPGMNPWIVINKDLLSTFENVQVTLMHETFHFVQGLYGSGNLWLDEASATWAEEQYKSGSGYLPLNFKGHGEEEMKMFSPLDPQGRSTAQHGYGSASLIKYLTDKHGRDKLVSLYENISKHSGIEDTLNAFSPIGTWINDYYMNFVLLKVYSGTTLQFSTIRQEVPKVTVGVFPGEVDPFNKDGVVKHSETIPAYGARFVNIELKTDDSDNVSESAMLVATSQVDGVVVNLFKAKGSKVEGVAGGETASLGQIKGMLKDKTVFMAMMVNQTNKPVSAEVAIEVMTPPPLEDLAIQWPMGKAKIANVYLHPEILRIAGMEVPENASPATEGNPFEGCDETMGKAIVKAFSELKELEGTICDASLTVAQTGDDSGTALYKLENVKGSAGGSAQSMDFTYKDGRLTGEIDTTEGKNRRHVVLDMNAVYDKKTEEIVLSGKVTMEIFGSGIKAIGMDLMMTFRTPIPERAFGASLPAS